MHRTRPIPLRGILPLVALTVCAVLTLSGCPDATSGPGGNHIDRAQRLLAEARTEAAIGEIKQILRRDPANGYARYLLGRAYLEIGDGVAAEAQLRKAAANGAAAPDLTASLLRALLYQGKFEEVVYQSADLADSTAELLTLRGRAFYGLEDAQRAERSFQEALRLAPESQAALLGLAQIALDQRRLDEAARWLARAPQGDLLALRLRGRLALLEGRYAAADKAFSEILSRRPRDVTARLGLVRALLGDGKAADALKQIALILEDDANNLEAIYLRAVAALKNGQRALAETSAREVLSQAPGHMPSLRILGSLQYDSGRLEQSDANLRRYLRSVPGDVDVRKTLAATRLRLGAPRQALAALRPALKDHPDDSILLTLAGTAQLQSGDVEHGTETLRRAARLAPSSPEVQLVGALAELSRGHVTRLERILDDKTLPEIRHATALRSVVDIAASNYAGALTHAQAAIEEDASDPLAEELAGVALSRTGHPEAAKAHFRRAIEIDDRATSARLQLARLALVESDLDAACTQFRRVLDSGDTLRLAREGYKTLRCRRAAVGSATGTAFSGLSRPGRSRVAPASHPTRAGVSVQDAATPTQVGPANPGTPARKAACHDATAGNGVQGCEPGGTEGAVGETAKGPRDIGPEMQRLQAALRNPYLRLPEELGSSTPETGTATDPEALEPGPIQVAKRPSRSALLALAGISLDSLMGLQIAPLGRASPPPVLDDWSAVQRPNLSPRPAQTRSADPAPGPGARGGGADHYGGPVATGPQPGHTVVTDDDETFTFLRSVADAIRSMFRAISELHNSLGPLGYTLLLLFLAAVYSIRAMLRPRHAEPAAPPAQPAVAARSRSSSRGRRSHRSSRRRRSHRSARRPA